MRSRGDATILFSGYGQTALRALVDNLANDVENDGIRVGMVTIDRAIPMLDVELKKIAALLWQLFITSEGSRKREIRFA